MKIDKPIEQIEYWPDVEKMISDKIVTHIVCRLKELDECEVLSNPLWISRTRLDTKDEPINEQYYLYGEDYPNGLSRYICERADYKGEILDFLFIRKKVGIPNWMNSYTHLLEEDNYKYIFDQLKKIGKSL